MQKIFTLILGILLVSSIQLNAAYLTNIPKTITQPDGTEINCFASGDEFHNWLHDKDNYTIIQSSDGYYYYAVKDGIKIVPSEYKVGTTYLKSTNIQPGVNITAEQWIQKRKTRPSDAPLKSYNLKDGEAEINIHKIAIYIRFKDDDEWVKDTATYWDMLNADHPDSISMINFYEEVSYGKVNVQSYFYPKSTTANVVSYHDTINRGFFQPYNETTNPEGFDTEVDWTDFDNEDGATKREWDLLERAVNYLNANYTIPASMDLDYDDDGYIDVFEFFIVGEAGNWSDLLWPHNWTIQDGRGLSINGILLTEYNFQIEEITDNRGVGVLSHEMGHALGYPDLYQYSSESTYTPVGPWDIMATTGAIPQSFGAFTKFKYGGWIASIPEITEAGTYSLKSVDSTTNNCYKIASPYSTTEYFLVEYRKKAGRFESSIPASGLLVYRINTLAGNGNANGVVDVTPDEVYIYRPNGTTNVSGNVYQAHYSADASHTEINNTTNPKAFLFDGKVGGLYISEVSAPGDLISFRVDFYPDALYPDFKAGDAEIFAWETVTFTDLSVGSPETWTWTFEGGSPATFDGETPPAIQYSTPGTYDVELTITKGSESMTETREDIVTVTALPGANPPRDLEAEVTEANPNDVVLSWTEPESGIQEFTIQWDDGVNDGSIGQNVEPDSYDALSHWLPNDLTPYDDWYITEISFYPNSSNPSTVNDYTLNIYTGADTLTLIVDQAIHPDSLTFDQWNTFTLDTPYQIDASVDLWFGANNDSGTEISGYPFGTDNGPAIDEKGDVLYYASDSSIYYFHGEWGLNYNWNISATVVNSLEEPKQKSSRIENALMDNYKSMDGYNIYRDGVKVNSSIVTETSYTETSVADGNYDYFVTAVFTAGESIASNTVNVQLPYGSVGIPQVEIKELTIYPNPVKDNLFVQLEELSNEPLSLRIFDQQGKLVYSQEIIPNSDKIEIAVNNLSNGAYTLLMYTTEKAFQGKFIVLN